MYLLSLSFVCDSLSLIGVACISLYLNISRRSKKLIWFFEAISLTGMELTKQLG